MGDTFGEPDLSSAQEQKPLRIRVEQPEQPPTNLFTRRDVEPVLSQEELVVLSGFWPGHAMIRSRVILRSNTLVALHIICYPRYGFSELWRYYACQAGIWYHSSWQQLPIAARLRVLE